MGLAKGVLLALMLVAVPGLRAAPPEPRDIPAGHWAATAARELVASGVLPTGGGLFRGEGTIRRDDLAVIVAQVLGRLGTGPGTLGATDRAKLSALVAELRPELSGLRARVDAQVSVREDLAARIERLKAGSGSGAGPRPAFSGLVAVGLVGNDEGADLPLPAGGLTPARSRFAFPLEQEFFTLPQASIALDREVGDGLALHLQLDYATDALNPLFGGGVTGCRIPIEMAPRRAGDPPVLVGSSDRARSILGWSPRYADLETIVAHAWAWHRLRQK